MNVNYIIKSLENLNEYVIMYQEMVSIMVNKDTYVSLVIKHLLILHSLLAITLKKTFRNG